MSTDDTNWEALRKERQVLVERIRALPLEEAWREVRAALESSPSLYTDRLVLTVYEGPTRAFLLPLPYELLRDFTERRGATAIDRLREHTSDAHPLVAAYCLHALVRLEDPRLPEAVARVAGRTEKIHAIYGSFARSGTLAQYGRQLLDDYHDSLGP
jgi:hypothetical protein